MEQIPTWKAYDRMAAAGDYGTLLSKAGKLTLSLSSSKIWKGRMF